MVKESNKELVLMVGIPGSGKSTFTKTHNITGYKVISRDEIRFNLVKPDEEYFSKETEVFSTFVSKTKEALANGENVIADATFINEASRTKFLRALGGSLEKTKIIAVKMDTPLEVCLERNEKRTGRAKVPREAIRRMELQSTTPDLEEGFDEIYIYKGKEVKVIAND